MGKITEVIFDVETQKFFDEITSNNPGDLGISIVSVFKRELDENLTELTGEMFSFWEDEIEKLWPIFQHADRIVGFNSLHFDVPALQPYSPIPLSKLPHFDILKIVKESFGRRIGLNALATETLHINKIDHGANAVMYWKKHDKESLAKLKKYCEADVLITKDLYDFGLKNKQLSFKDKWNSLRTIDIDFSHPAEMFVQNMQVGLF